MNNPFVTTKSARFTEFDLQGPQSIDQALSLYFQAKALAQPSDKTLRSHNMNEDDFAYGVGRLEDKVDKKDQKFDVSSIAPSPVLRGIGGGLAGLAAGHVGSLGMDSPIKRALVSALGAVAGAGAGVWNANHRRGQLLKTMKLMRSYGLNTPSKFNQAAPLLSSLST